MKKFIESLVLFIIYSILIYFILIFVWGKFVPKNFKPNLNYKLGMLGHMNTRIKEVQNYQNIDILFIGSSRAYRSFDIRIFKANNYSSFNFGSSAQTPLQTMLLINRYIEKLNPKLIIYAVTPEMLTNDGVESSLDIIANDRLDFLSLTMALSINSLKVYNTLIYSFEDKLFRLNQHFKEPLLKGKDCYIKGGYVKRNSDNFTDKKNSISISKFNNKQLQIFEDILMEIKKRNIKLMLVYPPVYKIFYKSNNLNPSFNNLMIKHENFFNFNDISNLGDSIYFFDSFHLNQKGVDSFNLQLLKLIHDKMILNKTN